MEAALLTAEGADAPAKVRKPKAWWLEPLEPYARPDVRRSLTCLATSLVPYLALWPAMYYSLRVSYWLTLLIAIPAAGFLVRTFIVFHDCGHGSFFPNKRANRVTGGASCDPVGKTYLRLHWQVRAKPLEFKEVQIWQLPCSLNRIRRQSERVQLVQVRCNLHWLWAQQSSNTKLLLPNSRIGTSLSLVLGGEA